MPRSLPWTDVHLACCSCRGRQHRGHLWQFFGDRLRGVDSVGGRKLPSDWQSQSPLTQGWHYSTACDPTVWPLVNLSRGHMVKYDQNYLYLCPFLGTRLPVRPVDGFSRMMAQTTPTSVTMFFFGICHMAHHWRGQKHQTSNFGAWIGVFKPHSRNRKTCLLSKLLHRNFA